ncbi:MAG: DUF2865 domain-containing protein, partial [Pseudorhodoplanes sp.]|nr:DUF2865 domain-containing protein [Pseudorhodoplanes sp.]
MCPAAEAVLYTHRNPGEDMNQAVSAGGRLYTELPNAFKFRQEFNAACSCKKQGETWAEALKGTEDRSTIEQGDILVTDERAKAMNAPRDAKGRPILPPKGKPNPKTTAAAAPPAEPAAAPEEPASDAPKPPIRTVGPQLGPVR